MRQNLKAKDLVKILEGLDPETIILTPGFDHSYTNVSANLETVAFDTKSGDAVEYYHTETLGPTEYLVKALIIG
jgi:hypothetical protein